MKQQTKKDKDPFYFDFPFKQIAPAPPVWRDQARLMVLHRDSGKIEHRFFKDILDYFGKGDLFVLNNTKVIPSVLKVRADLGIRIVLLRELSRNDRIWDALAIVAGGKDREIYEGAELGFELDPPLKATVRDKSRVNPQFLRLKFDFDGDEKEFRDTLFGLGMPYIPQWVKPKTTSEDRENYQTVFAKVEGAISAPGAGLHFSQQLLYRMVLKDIGKAFITLHQGIGHFRTIPKVRKGDGDCSSSEEYGEETQSQIADEKEQAPSFDKKRLSWASDPVDKWVWREAERLSVSEEAAAAINSARRAGKKVVAVGASVIRGLETATTVDKEVRAYEGWAEKFIHPTFPAYRFSIPDAIISNFHIPQSPSLMCVAAYGGCPRVMDAYDVALKEKYKFGPYGDAMLIL